MINQPIYTGTWGNCHIQGIAVDKKQGYIYYSFTTKLVKSTLDGKIIGSYDGLIGHLGCIAFNEDDGCVYGSLEYKNDSIGKGILGAIKSLASFDNAFYVAKFDVDKIDRIGMTAEDGDVMECVYLREVVEDYMAEVTAPDGSRLQHRYGCSGIDGLTLAPLPGEPADSKKHLLVSYGIYLDESRQDNDYQVILCYDISEWSRFFRPLDQNNMHSKGPSSPLHKFFVYTGNTCYGVQNLEYDRYTNSVFMAVYRGKKPSFPNYDLFAIDMTVAPQKALLRGIGEYGECLTLAQMGDHHTESGVRGWRFPYGSTGMFSFGDGSWLFSENRKTTAGQCSYIFGYEWNGKAPFVTKG